MSDHEVESPVEGLGGLASGSPSFILMDLFYEIPHSCLEYGTRVIG